MIDENANRLLPAILRSRSQKLSKISHSRERFTEACEKEIQNLARLLELYKVDFPFFTKLDAWRAEIASPNRGEEDDLWVLERLGWGNWKNRYQLIYVMEGICIPPVENAEVVSVNCSSPPFLQTASRLDLREEIGSDQVKVSELEKLPNALREKSLEAIPEWMDILADTMEQMKTYENEFSKYLEQKIQEYSQQPDGSDFRKEDIRSYFQHDRKVELFFEFLEDQGL